MEHVWSAQQDDRSSAERVAARLLSNAYRWFVVADACTEEEAADYVAALERLGCEAYTAEYTPPPCTRGGYVTTSPEWRRANVEQQLADNPNAAPVEPPKRVYARHVDQGPATVRVHARWCGAVNADAGASPQRRRLGAK
jgi:hypothetical protein